MKGSAYLIIPDFVQSRDKVTCVDKNPDIVQQLSQGIPTIYEDGLAEILERTRGLIEYRTDIPLLNGTGVVMIAVGTPSREDGDADLSFVDAAAREVAERIEAGAQLTIVNKSTVPIGSAQHVAGIVRRCLDERGIDATVHVTSNPEFLAEGQALNDTFYPDRIVIGADDPAAIGILRQLYAPLLEQTFEPPPGIPRPERYPLPPLITTTPTSAELTKYAANAFLATKISFINEFAGLAEKIGADITEVARAIGLDERIGPRFLHAGIGWGGSCFGKDTRAIIAAANHYQYDMSIVSSAVDVNYRQRDRILTKLQDHLKVLRGTTVGVLGLTFKGGTNDLRDAPAITLIQRLHNHGVVVRAHDPVAIPYSKKQFPNLTVAYCDEVLSLARGCDAVVIATDWPQYRSLPLTELRGAMKGELLLDARNLLNPDEVVRAGLTYVGVGR